MPPGLESDLFGDYARISVDRSVYSDAAIFKAAYWFTDRFFVYLDSAPSGRLTVELRAKELSDSADLNRGCADFCNSLVDYRVRDLVLKETGAVREALVLKAFSEGVPKAGFPSVTSNETHIAKRE